VIVSPALMQGQPAENILGWRGVADWPDGKIISEAQSRNYW
jgi:hypothetical protein